MARIETPEVTSILEAAQQWRDRCLIGEGSVFTDRLLWTRENLEALKQAFLGNLIEDSERSFYEKLGEQLDPYPADIKCLASELIWFMMLFPAGVSGDRKRTDIRQIWGWSGESLPSSHALLGTLLDHGIGRAGIAYHTLRWREFGLFIELMLEFRALAVDHATTLLSDPWQFADWVDTSTPSKNRPFRHILLHLLFPDHFERIGNARHKRAIIYAFSGKIGPSLSVKDVRSFSRLELDKAILQIRKQLETEYPGTMIDFYQEPITGTFSLTFPPPREGSASPKDFDVADPNSTEAVANTLSSDPSVVEMVLAELVNAIRLAHEESPHRWAITMSRHRIHLNVGRCLILSIRRGRIGVSAITKIVETSGGAASVDVLSGLKIVPFSIVSGLNYYTVAASEINDVLPLLRPGLGPAIKAAAQTARRPVGLKQHAPAVLDYLDEKFGNELPRPSHQLAGGNVVPEAVAVNTPASGFRATELDLDDLMSDIARGDIGLPDIQRPFVWTSPKVRDLFDSMYRGYPVGYLLFWETNAVQQNARVIGTNTKAFTVPKRLIVDGQQRLTSLYAVMRGVAVLDSDYKPIKIDIAFRPRDGRFEVADAAIRRDPEYIASISDLLSDRRGAYSLTHEFITRLGEKRNLSDNDRHIIAHNLNRLFQLRQFRFSVLEISAELEEEAVADIFVRINSQGVKLNQADFILTLLSVIWEEGRSQLEVFSKHSQQPASQGGQPTPFNHLIKPSPDQMLRVSVAAAFYRARLRSVYQLLRGKDPDTGALVPERRAAYLQRLQQAQTRVLDLNNWHRFLGCITSAGFRLSEQISSENALLTAYALYLHGLTISQLTSIQLDRVIGQWFWMAILTSRFSGPTETMMEEDLVRIREASTPEEFLQVIEKAIQTGLTNDYWQLTLPMDLETSSTRSSAWSAFVASQLRLDAPVLFSDKKLWALLDPLSRGTRRPFEAHHLFPKALLAGRAISDRKEVNQVANLSLLEWPSNMKAGARAPADYVPELRKHLGDGTWERMSRLHALPPGWELMEYDEFLSRRRELMAELIRRGFESLGGLPASTQEIPQDGSAEEQAVWRDISALERELRAVIRGKYSERWGDSADARIHNLLGTDGIETVNRNRAKYLKQYKFSDALHGDEILDFLYLGQLRQLMTAGDAWALFTPAFRDKRQLEDLTGAIIPVRNDAAHFRSVPPNELDRCRIAVGDLRSLLKHL